MLESILQDIRKNQIKYRIFYIENNKEINVELFWMNNDDEAYNHLLSYSNIHKDHEYFYSKFRCIRVQDKNGDIHEYDNTESYINSILTEKTSILEKIKQWFYNLKISLINLKFNISDIIYILKTKHSLKETWSIDYYTLNLWKFNIKKLILNSNAGISDKFLILAFEQIHPEISKTEFLKKHPNHIYDDKVYELAKELWNNEMMKFINAINLYQYYASYGIIDKRDNEQIQIDKLYHNTIPYKLGTNKEIHYDKIQQMIDEKWNYICDWFKEHGRQLWD